MHRALCSKDDNMMNRKQEANKEKIMEPLMAKISSLQFRRSFGSSYMGNKIMQVLKLQNSHPLCLTCQESIQSYDSHIIFQAINQMW